MKFGAIGQLARSLARSVIGRPALWVGGIAVGLALGLFFLSRVSRMSLSRVNSLEFLAAGVVVALGSIFLVLPTVLVRSHGDLTREQLLKARNDVRTAGIQILGGAVLLAGLLFTNRSLDLNRQSQELTRQSQELTRQGQITDRFTKATAREEQRCEK
jgi:hypothetical protein